MKNQSELILTGFIAFLIAAVGSIYLLLGHNSVVFTLIIATLAALAGNQIPNVKHLLKRD